MIGRPVHRDDRWAYLGTQYLAERLKTEGVAGLLYDSALKRGGTNVALFSENGIRPLTRELGDVTAVEYTTAVLESSDALQPPA